MQGLFLLLIPWGNLYVFIKFQYLPMLGFGWKLGYEREVHAKEALLRDKIARSERNQTIH